MKLILIMLVFVLAHSSVGNAIASGVSDADGDLVPDAIDNCVETPNGPNEGALNQLDGDQDGYGNACDADFNNSGATDGLDLGLLIAAFNTANVVIDLTGDGIVNGADYRPWVALSASLPGPSGLACAGTIPCLP